MRIHSTGTVYAPFYSNYHAVTNDQVLTTTSSGVPIVCTNDIAVTLPAGFQEGAGGYSCKLDEKMFVQKIKLASKINKNKLKKNASNLLEKISTKVVDSKYFNLILKLVNEKNSTSY